VATPDLATGWDNTPPSLTGEAPLPSIAGYPGPTVQDVLEQVAQAASTRIFFNSSPQSGIYSFSGTTVSGGAVLLDLESLVPGIVSANLISAINTDEGFIVGMGGALGDLSNYEVLFKDITTGGAAGSGLPVNITISAVVA